MNTFRISNVNPDKNVYDEFVRLARISLILFNFVAACQRSARQPVKPSVTASVSYNKGSKEKLQTFMKKIFLILLTFVAAIATLSAKEKAEMTFATLSHDFGTIKADGGAVTAVYEFTNTGSAPLTIINVSNGGCGCTKPSFPKKPIAPGKKGEIKITFQPKGRAGEFNRTVKVKSNASKSRINLTFNGVIIPEKQQ